MGSKEDVDSLTRLFEKLGFSVHLKQDLTALKMKAFAEEESKDLRRGMKETDNLDMLVFVILTHGGLDEESSSDKIYGTDGEFLHPQKIFAFFNNDNCPALMGKPKFFIIQVRAVVNTFGKNFWQN